MLLSQPPSFYFFFFNDTATTEIYTLSLHDALPISPTPLAGGFAVCKTSGAGLGVARSGVPDCGRACLRSRTQLGPANRSEEHTSELQSHLNLVCRLLLEKKKKNIIITSK